MIVTPGAADWQNIPTDVLDQVDMQQKADDWAKDQYAKLAQDWADTQHTTPMPSGGGITRPDVSLGAVPSEPAAGASPIQEPSAATPSLPPDAAPAPAAGTTPTDNSSWLGVAQSQLGKPYIWGSVGGRSDFGANAAGFDCSGFVSYVMKNGLGINLPAQTASAYTATQPIKSGDAKPGDVVLYNMGDNDPHVQHIAIYLGNGQVIQAGGSANTRNVNVAPIATAGTYEFRRPVGSPNADLSQKQVANVAKTAAPDDAQSDTLTHNPLDAVSNWVTQTAAPAVSGAVGGAASALGGALNAAATGAGLQQTNQNLSQAAQPISSLGTGGTPDDRQQSFFAAMRGAGEWTPQAIAGAVEYGLPMVAGLVGPGGDVQAAKAGAGILKDALEQLKNYPSDTRQPIEEFVTQAQKLGQSDSSIGATIQRWVGENPPPKSAEEAQSALPGSIPAAPVTQAPPDTTGFGQFFGSPGMGKELALSMRQADLASAERRMADLLGKYPGMTPDQASETPLGQQIARYRDEIAQRKTELSGVTAATPAKVPPDADILSQWQTQLENMRATRSYQEATPVQQTQMVADAQGDFANDIQAAQAKVNAAANMPQTVSSTGVAADLPKGGGQGPWSPIFSEGGTLPSARGPVGPALSPQALPQKAGITPDTVQAAHERINRALTEASPEAEAAHARLNQMIQSGATPDEIGRFLSGEVEGNKVGPTSILRSVRTGSMAGGLTTEAKVALSPIIQTAMRAPVGALKAIVQGQPGDIGRGLQGGLAGLAEGAADGLQTLRYGTNYRAALTGGAQGGYGFKPGIDVMGSNVAQRLAGTAALGLVRTHGALADVSAGIGRGAALATGATPEAAGEIGQQWALRSGNYGTIGKAVANAFEGLRQTNPALDVVGQILMPFYRVGYNVLTQGIERSPVGLAGTGFDVARGALGKGPYVAGAVNKAVTPVGDRLANNMFGVGLAALGFSQAAQGNITGANPQGGAPKWSVRIAGQWVPQATFGPAQEALAQSAALYEAARDGRGDVTQIAQRTAESYVGRVYDTSWLRGIGDGLGMAKDVSNIGSTNPQVASQASRDLQYQGGSLGKSFVPQSALIGQTAKAAGNPDLAGTFLEAAGMARGAGQTRRPIKAPAAPRAPRPGR